MKLLLGRRKKGICLTKTQDAALKFVKQFNVSLATAYRWVAAGIIDPGTRRIGGDGKWRMLQARQRASLVRHHLLRSANEFRHAGKRACEIGITVEEIEMLARLESTIAETLERWRSVT